MTRQLVGEQFGEYRLIRLIGRGGFADVYLGEHTRHQTMAAVKVLHTRLEPEDVKSFLNEARSMRLRHPHIVQVLDFGLEDDVPFLVMDYAPHGSLRQRYPKGTQLPLGTIRRYVKQLAGALQYAHHEGVIHRDVKPDNMLLGRQGELLLTDFGIASLAHTTASMSETDQAGTIPYMAPEQLQGRPRPASDQYSLGIVVYEWICGTGPFQGTFAEISSQHLSAPPPSLRKRVPALPIVVEHVVMRALAKDPHRRFPSIAAFASAFEQACRQASAARRPLHRNMDPPPPASSKEKAMGEHPMREHANKPSSEERPARPKTRFQAHEDTTVPVVSPTKGAAVLKQMRVSLTDAWSHLDDTINVENIARGMNVKALLSTVQQRVRAWSFAFFLLLVSLMLAGILLAGASIGIVYSTFHTSTVTITPNSFELGNTFEISAVTGAPDPHRQEIALRSLTATSVKASRTVPATGTSIPGTRATGSLTFLDSTASNISFGSVVLRGASGVPVTFNGPITVYSNPGFLTVTGYAVNVGSAGNIGALDISGSCCTAGITVKNGAFSGGRDPIQGMVVQQSDIDGATSALTAALTPQTQAALQKQVRSNEQVLALTLQCRKSTYATNHAVGEPASSVTVTVAMTCQEEVFDQLAALTMAKNLLKAQVAKDTLVHYALMGNVTAEITYVTENAISGTVVISVRSAGEWVYQFTHSVIQDFANHIAAMNKQSAWRYLLSQPGVKAVTIDDDVLPDAAHIAFQFMVIPGVSTFSHDATPTGQPLVSPSAGIPLIKPSPTQGLGGS
jgi:serine/threonine protein kinase